MSTKITVDNQAGTIKYVADPISPQLYDLAGEISGTPPINTRVFDFKAIRAFTIKTGGVAGCVTEPAGGSVTFDIQKIVSGTPTSIGSIAFADGASTGTVTISSDVSVAVDNIIAIVSPGNLYSISTIFWTLNGICP
jgi:hypothetical protein